MSGGSSLDALLAQEIVERGVAPSAASGIARNVAGRWVFEHGSAGRAGSQDTTANTVFDLASLTKPFVAVALARLVEQGMLEFETALAELIAEAGNTPSARTSLELLGSHRGGLAANGALFAPLVERRAVGRREAFGLAAGSVRVECTEPLPPSGAAPVYSDLGYLLLGEALSRASGLALDELVFREVCEPLGSKAGSARRWLALGESFLDRVAPTEYVPFRGGVVRGVVHDENAWALSGHAISGHAGLFGRVSDVLALGAALLDAVSGRSERYLRKRSVERLLEERPGGTLRLGFDGKSAAGSSAGPSASTLTFGHLGFTGTSFWCDPAADTVTVLLTNRVHPTRDNLGIREARPRVHEALFARARTLGGVGGRDITD